MLKLGKGKGKRQLSMASNKILCCYINIKVLSLIRTVSRQCMSLKPMLSYIRHTVIEGV